MGTSLACRHVGVDVHTVACKVTSVIGVDLTMLVLTVIAFGSDLPVTVSAWEPTALLQVIRHMASLAADYPHIYPTTV